MEKIFITGGAGFVGSHHIEVLLSRGKTIRVVDYLPLEEALNLQTVKDHPNFEYIQADIVEYDQLAALQTKEFDTVFHFASIVGIKKYVETPLRVIDVNVIGTRNVLKLALEHDQRLLFSSTSEIYGKNPNPPWKEDYDRVLGPTTVERWTYSTSKATAEHMLHAMVKSQGLRASVIRYFNVYGPRQNPIFVVSQNVQRVINGEQPKLYDDGMMTRCFTFVKDAVEATIKVTEEDKCIGEVFNIGADVESTMKEVLEAIIELTGSNLEIEYVDTGKLYGNKYEDINRRIPDVNKIREHLGWRATTTLKQGLQQTINWAKDNQWWLDLKR